MEPWMVIVCWILGILAGLFAWISHELLNGFEEVLDEDRYSYIDPDTGQRVAYAYPMPPADKTFWRPATISATTLGAVAVVFLSLAGWFWRIWPNW